MVKQVGVLTRIHAYTYNKVGSNGLWDVGKVEGDS